MEVSGANAAQSRDEFLQLLVAQLRNQDPLEPVKQEDFLAQLAQFSTLEGIENLNANFSEQLDLQRDAIAVQQMTQAADLIGKQVTYDASDGTETSGVVDSIRIEADGMKFVVGSDIVAASHVRSIGNDLASGDELTTSPDQQPEPNTASDSRAANLFTNGNTSTILP